MNVIDRIKAAGASVFGSGGTAYHGASTTSRELAGWNAPEVPADDALSGEVPTLASRSQDLDRNNPTATNIRVTKNDNVVGTGLQCQPQINWRVIPGMTAKRARELQKTYKAEWQNFSQSRYFDADGEDHFHLQTKLIYDSKSLSGSGVAIPMWKERPGTVYRTCLKIIDAARLSNPEEKEDTPTLASGVERDASGEIQAYHIQNIHPGDSSSDGFSKWERIPAFSSTGRRKFIHVYEKTRPGQSRGVPLISNVISHLALKGKYEITEAQAAIMASNIAGIMETDRTDQEAAEMFGGKPEDYAKLRGTWNGKLTAGMILKLPPGTRYSAHIPNRPATAFAAFMEVVSREIGVGASLPFELSARNFSKTNYSSARAALLEAWRHFKVERALIAYQWAGAVYELWFEEAVDLGRIEAPGYIENRQAYSTARWIAPGLPEIDALKSANANKIKLEYDGTTLEEIHAEHGNDWEDVLEQRGEEQAKKLEQRYMLAEMEKKLREKYKVDLESEPSPEDNPDEPDPPQSDEEMDESDPDKNIDEEDQAE